VKPLALLAVLAAGALALSAGAAAQRPAPTSTSLTITVWPAGPAGAGHMRTLRCAPAGGTLADPAEACLRLSRLTRPFEPVPADAVCAQRVHGPQVALVRGRLSERPVWARLTRRDSCQEARWQRHAWLLRQVT
jgi:hypothetical protein